jgi:hypothetical protein
MSDRDRPHEQKANASGSGYRGSSTKHTITRLRPGALSPGGKGVDIKHNSYDRYLGKLKSAKALRQQAVPKNIADLANIAVFNPAFPIYGGKVMKTGIVSGCNCGSTNAIYANSVKATTVPFTSEYPVCETVFTCPTCRPSPVNKYAGYSQSAWFLERCAFVNGDYVAP